MNYIERAVGRRLDAFAQSFSAISIEGARAVGETETARRRVKDVFRMDRADDRNRFLATNL